MGVGFHAGPLVAGMGGGVSAAGVTTLCLGVGRKSIILEHSLTSLLLCLHCCGTASGVCDCGTTPAPCHMMMYAVKQMPIYGYFKS